MTILSRTAYDCNFIEREDKMSNKGTRYNDQFNLSSKPDSGFANEKAVHLLRNLHTLLILKGFLGFYIFSLINFSTAAKYLYLKQL